MCNGFTSSAPSSEHVCLCVRIYQICGESVCECVCVREKDKGFESGDGSLVTGFGFPAIVTGRL